jgi:hypothetical protein
MEKEFVPYKQALALKELGFYEETFGFYWSDTTQLVYDNAIGRHRGCHIQAPLYQQAFRWFREKYKLYSHVRESLSFDNTLKFVTQINGSYVNHRIEDKPINRFETYEEAELECLKKLIEIVKNK